MRDCADIPPEARSSGRPGLATKLVRSASSPFFDHGLGLALPVHAVTGSMLLVALLYYLGAWSSEACKVDGHCTAP